MGVGCAIQIFSIGSQTQMNVVFHLANVISIGAFLVYGLVCLLADGMVDEFERFAIH